MQLKSSLTPLSGLQSSHTDVSWSSVVSGSLTGDSGVEVLVPEDGGVVDVGVAPAVEVLRVAVYTVAAVHLRHGGGQGGHSVGGRAERLGVGQCAAELDAVLVPVPPQNTLHL